MGIKLAISNIAWSKEYDEEVYKFLKSEGFEGLEVAPTRILENNPYDNLEEAKEIKKYLKKEYGLNICSLQSIWYGKNEKIFGSESDRIELINYTKKAILFAEAVGAKNIVLGCPKNRIYKGTLNKDLEIFFFKSIAEYAREHNTVISIEPNPLIYGTNYINYTIDAVNLVRSINSGGLKLNLDFGTIIQNKENLEDIIENVDVINHVHISEPYLEMIKYRKEHEIFINKIIGTNYNGYVSIEMKNRDNIENVYKSITYLKSIIKESII